MLNDFVECRSGIFKQIQWVGKLSVLAKNTNAVKWFVDAAFAAHPDFKSHIGGAMKSGEGSMIISMSRKEKLNAKNTAESEAEGANGCMSIVPQTNSFVEAQRCSIVDNGMILHQNNKMQCFWRRTEMSVHQRERDITHFFFVVDQVERGNAHIEYCSIA